MAGYGVVSQPTEISGHKRSKRLVASTIFSNINALAIKVATASATTPAAMTNLRGPDNCKTSKLLNRSASSSCVCTPKLQTISGEMLQSVHALH